MLIKAQMTKDTPKRLFRSPCQKDRLDSGVEGRSGLGCGKELNLSGSSGSVGNKGERGSPGGLGVRERLDG